MADPAEILAFWLDELTPKDWYAVEPALDQKIRDLFLADWEAAMEGAHSMWLTYPSGALAYIILTDQFPRNMFREEGRAFSSDKMALATAKMAINKAWDMKIDPPARSFFYLPLMHSENASDQDRCVRLMAERLPEDSGNLGHAQAHRDVIRCYGRFPYRNEALGRISSAEELAYLEEGGYGATLRKLSA